MRFLQERNSEYYYRTFYQRLWADWWGGCILPLVIAILWVSKRQEQRQIAKFGLTTCLFNITEPIMFGLPVVMNPIYMIPCALIPSVNLIIAYFATSIGLIEKTVAAAPWITPPVIQSIYCYRR